MSQYISEEYDMEAKLQNDNETCVHTSEILSSVVTPNVLYLECQPGS